MRVLVACEESATVREAFKSKGHDAWSCDILPTRIPGQHKQTSIVNVLYEDWDLVIAHPPCTRLCNSGVRWLNERDLWQDMLKACDFFNLFQSYAKKGIPVCIENPIPHKYATEYIGKYNQIIQPWQYGHGETKATCLWLYGLPNLSPSNIVEGREQKIWKQPPGKERARIRSTTFQGIADAMADQWTEYFNTLK